MIAQSGDKFHTIRQTAANKKNPDSSQNSLVVKGLLADLKKIFKYKNDYSKAIEMATKRSEKLEEKRDKISFEKQVIYNFPKLNDGETTLKSNDFTLHLFADEVDHVNVDWNHIMSSGSFKHSCVWFAMNSERFNDNNQLVEYQSN